LQLDILVDKTAARRQFMAMLVTLKGVTDGAEAWLEASVKRREGSDEW